MYALIYDYDIDDFYVSLIRHIKFTEKRILTDNGVEYLSDQEIVSTHKNAAEAKQALKEKKDFFN